MVDMSEIRNVTANEEQLETARNRMGELGLLTPGGNPSAAKIGQAAQRKVPPMLEKLERRLRRTGTGAPGTVIRTMQMLYAQGDMQALYLYTAIFYGVIEWRVPGGTGFASGGACRPQNVYGPDDGICRRIPGGFGKTERGRSRP